MLADSGAAGLAGMLDKKFGFSRSPRQAPVFYGLVTLGTVGGTLLTVAHVDPVQLLSSAPSSTALPPHRS